jgi:hypothetical protein
MQLSRASWVTEMGMGKKDFSFTRRGTSPFALRQQQRGTNLCVVIVGG